MVKKQTSKRERTGFKKEKKKRKASSLSQARKCVFQHHPPCHLPTASVASVEPLLITINSALTLSSLQIGYTGLIYYYCYSRRSTGVTDKMRDG